MEFCREISEKTLQKPGVKQVGMKVRITNNKIRYRLKQQEVETFANAGIITEILSFGDSEVEQLRFSLQQMDINLVDINFQQNHTIILVPILLSKEWTGTDRIGFDAVVKNGQGKIISLLVEKDFMCMDGRDEDNEGNYPNPLVADNI
jgi:hypothetical protein